MSNTINRTRSILVLALAAGVLATTFGLFGSDALPSVSAQTDTTAPTISSVAITSDPDDDGLSSSFKDGVYGIGDSIEVTVTFSENIIVTGTPRLALSIGGGTRSAAYQSVDGSVAVFSYTVAEGDTDTDGIAIGANELTLNGGTIRDAANNASVLSHSSIAEQTGHKVDGIRPRMTRFAFIGSTDGQNGFYTAGEELSIDAPWSEDIRLSRANGIQLVPTISVDIGGTARTCTLGSGFGFWHFNCAIKAGDYDADGPTVAAGTIQVGDGWIRDTAGNPAVLTHGALSADSGFKVDAVLPYVTGVAITSSPTSSDGYTAGEAIRVTVTFNETVTVARIARSGVSGNPKPKMTINVGGEARTANFQSTNGNTVVFAYTVVTGDEDSDGVSIDANELSLNAGAIVDQARNTPLSTENEWILNLGLDARVPHSALANDANHKVSANSSSPITLSGNTTVNYAENGTSNVGYYTLPGSDNAITWSLSGDDSDDFSLAGSSASGRALRFTSSPNYEDPTDANTDNRYDVTIQASDGTNTGVLQITVVVTNVLHDADELPVLNGTVRVGETLTVDTSPIQNVDRIVGYAWVRIDGDTEVYIDGATGRGSAFSSYTLTDDDEGKTIKVQVGFWTTDEDFILLRSAPTAAVKPTVTVSGITSSNYAENGTSAVATYAVADAGGSTITWSLSGDDSGDFSISSAGVLSFSSSPDYESPADANTDNVYQVTIQASEGTSTGTLDVTVTVTNVNEGPTLN